MEKFTKFDDKKTGVNPFLPPRAAKLGALLFCLKIVLILPIFLVKLVLLIILYPPYLVLHIAKYLVCLFCAVVTGWFHGSFLEAFPLTQKMNSFCGMC